MDQELVIYRYHATCASFSVSENTILALRVAEFERQVLSKWDNFIIWNAGKQGKMFYNYLKEENKVKVSAFCDVDVKKIARGTSEMYEKIDGKLKLKRRIPIISYKNVRPPFVVCVKLDLTGGQLESYLEQTDCIEGRDYCILS